MLILRISIGLVLTLAACAPLPDVAVAPIQNIVQTPDVRIDLSGRCFATYAIGDPIMTTTTEQVEVVPAEYDAFGRLVTPAVFRNEDVTRETSPAPTSEFEMLCPPALTPERISDLQRALTARGIYSGPIDGQLNAPTGEAVRLLQLSDANRSINSSVLSLATAQELGLVPLNEDQIDALQ